MWTRNETKLSFGGAETEVGNEFGGTIPFGGGGTEEI